ncbi:MAG: M48 family metalloprotease [Armatimonadota bacterium]|nr:M48 family metalloprotease [Armatimonadota bacterium]MDR7612207.1 M48 family metalloprotease [Armatimonadota bacterium]
MSRPLAVILAVLAALPAVAGAQESEEVRLGRIYARRLEAQYRLVRDPAAVARVGEVGRVVAAASGRPELPYTFAIVDLEPANAISLPGGFIYVTRGLLEFVRSDHELAAVLAHEVAHAARRHQMEMIRRSNEAAFWTLLVALLTRDAALAQGAHLLSASLLSGYTRDLERDADLAAVDILTRTPYTPVALLTVLERLARDERLRPPVNAGAFRDHPATAERVASVLAELRRRGIPVVRRPAANYLRVGLRLAGEPGAEVAEVLVNDVVVVRLTDPVRARAVVERLDRFFDTDPDPGQVAVLPAGPAAWEVVGGARLLVTVTTADAAALGLPLADAARQVAARLQWVIREDLRQRQFTG